MKIKNNFQSSNIRIKQMKKIIFALMLILVVSSVYATYTGHAYQAKQHLLVTYFNHESSKIKNVQASAYIPDLDIYSISNNFNIRAKDSGRVYLTIEIPHDAQLDFYPVILRLENDKGVREKKHTWIEVY